jgi:two-component system response regulator YesN
MLFISPNYLSRLFKKATGEGFNEYIVRKRIEKAKLLLETTNLKTNQIAILVGYRDTNYFSLAIKKSTGMCPKNFRDICQKNAMTH